MGKCPHIYKRRGSGKVVVGVTAPIGAEPERWKTLRCHRHGAGASPDFIVVI